jgi:hypothetical protein
MFDAHVERPGRCATLYAWLSCLLLAACAHPFVAQPGPDVEPVATPRYQTLTNPVTLFADTQEHEPTGYPLHDNDSAVDAYVEVAQRPPEQPLFGRRILEWALTAHGRDPWIHLGDVLDLSCRSEGQRMLRMFRHAQGPGAVLPGNHDGLMFGIYSYRILDAVLDSDSKHWNEACRRGASPEDRKHKTASEALSKRDFLQVYIERQLTRRGAAPGLTQPPAEGEHRLSWRNPDPDAFLTGIEARLLDGYRYADSFMAQRLRLPPAPGATRQVVVVALDTNQAGPLATTWDTVMGRSPGSRGHVHQDQLDAVAPWVDEAARAGHLVIFAGHHNWQSLGLASRIRMRAVMHELKHPLVYLSAHTHRGFWAVHRVLDRRPVLELNVSSLSDWPINYRRLTIAYDEHANRILLRAPIHPDAGRPVRSDRDLLAAWTQDVCAAVGPEPEAFTRFDHAMVHRQRAARGGVLEWLVSGLGSVCESCKDPLYQHGHAYQDALLDTILQLSSHLGQRAHRLDELKLPPFCEGRDFYACANAIKARTPTSHQERVELFRHKAVLADLMSAHLDDLDTRQAAAYMACRAVHAAKIDFDLTDEAHNNFRSEANRAAEQFFRAEASVGMD